MCRALVILVALATGCGEDDVEQLAAIKSEVCECKTSACGEAAMRKVPEREIASNRKTQRVAREMMDCLKKLYDRERPITDPDAELPPAASGGSAAGP